MPKRSKEVDQYIANAAPFARPILERIRTAFHDGCPDLEETMKWRVPHFDYKGVLGSMAAFKQHVAWGFWKAKLMNDPEGMLGEGPMGRRITSASELPPHKTMVAFVREAARLNEEGAKLERASPKASAPVKVPADLAAALKKNRAAAAAFEKFSPSHKREYAQWIAEAKQEATRQKRLHTAIEWIAEGKPRNWKYMKN